MSDEILNLSIDKSTLRVKNRESKHCEFKLEYNGKNLPKFAKTMAAFSNRDGGVLFFGIKDRPRELVGIKESDIPDDVEISNFLSEYFQSEIHFYSKVCEYYGKIVYAIVVSSSERKPVICRKAKTIKQGVGNTEKVVLREGAIYYRYSASSEEIKFAELRAILDEDRETFFQSMVDNLTLVNQVGYDKAAVVSAEDFSGSNQTASVYLTNNVAKNLNWIEQGNFVEDPSEGSDAYYVVRNVEIKHGVEIPKPTGYSVTHPLTKTELTKRVKIASNHIDGVLWKLGIKNNPVFHFSSYHGKNIFHKFTENTAAKITEKFPIEMEKNARLQAIKKLNEEYKNAQRG